jgi:sugar lactone lactonase YvrE
MAPPQALAAASNGTIGADSKGSVYYVEGSQLIRQTPDGVKHPIDSAASQATSGIAVDSAGNVYAFDNVSANVYRYTPGGQKSLFLSQSPASGPVFDSADNLYMPDWINDRLVKRTPAGVTTVLISGMGQVTQAAIDGSDIVYVADAHNSVVLRVAPTGEVTTAFSGLQCTGLASTKAGVLYCYDPFRGLFRIAQDGARAQIYAVIGGGDGMLAMDADENLYVARANQQAIMKITPGAANLGAVNVCGSGQTPAPCSQSVTLTYAVTASGTLGATKALTGGASNLDYTVSGNTCTGAVAAGSTCSVTVTYTPRAPGMQRGALEIADAAGNVISSTALAGVGMAPQIAFGPGSSSTFAAQIVANAMATDASGNVFVAAADGSLLKISSSGVRTTLLPSGITASGMALDGSGNLYVPTVASILRITPGGAQSAVVTGLVQPVAVAVNEAGVLYAVDAASNSVIRIAPNGNRTTVATGLLSPSGIAVDQAGNAIVADTFNNRVLRISAAGVQTTIGSGFLAPHHVAVDASGAIFVADSQKLVRISTDGVQTSWIQSAALHAMALDRSGALFVSQDSSILKYQRTTPAELRFPDTPYNTLSSTILSIPFDNIGNQPLTLSNLTVGTHFTQLPGPGSPADCAIGTVLDAGRSCNLTVGFRPANVGQISSVAPVVSNSLNNPSALIAVPLSGRGLISPQTITFNPIADQILGASVTLSATSDSGLVVSFASTTSAVCSVNGSSATTLSTGTCTVQATQPGNTQYSAATPVSRSFTVNAKPQVITFNAIADQIVGASVTLSATSDSGLAVSFASTTPAVCSVSGSTATTLSTGTCTIQATQAGNGSYSAAAPVSQSFAVNAKSQTITFGAIPAQSVGGTVALSATADSGLPVSFASTTPAVCSVSGTTASLIATGTCTIQATQAGNGSYSAAAPVSQSFAVNANSQTITFGAIADQIVGASVTLSATSDSGLVVSFASTTPAVCSVSGSTAATLATGTCTIQATQPGNAQYSAATPVSRSFAVNANSQTITFGAIAAQSVGGSVALSATATSGLPVSFTSTTPAVCTVSGTTASLIATGACTIQATQAGNGSYSAAAPVSQSFAVNANSQTITFGAIAAQTVGGTVALSATATSGLPVSFASTTPAVCTVSGTTASLIATGACTIQATQAGNGSYSAAAPVSQSFAVNARLQTISFGAIAAQTVGGNVALSATATSGLPVSFASTTPAVCTVSGATASLIAAGACTIQATQAGNGSYSAAAPVSQNFAVNTRSQTISFGAIPSQSVGGTVALSASATSGLPVSFASTTPAVCSVSGTTASLIAAGACAIRATQAGNGSYSAAAPVSQSFAVTAATSFTITPVLGTTTVKRGVVAAFLLRLNSVNGFHGDVRLSCSGGPAGSYCANLPQTVRLDGTAYALSGVLFPASTPNGSYTITFEGVSGTQRVTARATFTVK